MTFLNLLGLHVSAKINDYCATIGTLFPICLLIILGVIWAVVGDAIQISFAPRDLLPSLGSAENWVSLIAIIASYLGMELSGVHVNDIVNPQKNFPKALGLSVAILLSTMLLGSLAIAMVIPGSEIRLVDGFMQTFSQFFRTFGMGYFIHILPLFIIVGSIGGMINWLLSPAKGLMQAAHFGFLPPYFAVKNKRGVPARILFLQAILVSFFCLAFTLMPSINAFYWFLTTLSTELYLFMYILMFFSALKLGRPTLESGAYQIRKGFRILICSLGLFGCFLTIVVGFFPPAGIDVGGAARYSLLIGAGNLLLISPAGLLLLYERSKRSRR